MKSDFKIGDRVYCFVWLSYESLPGNEKNIMLSPGIYTISDVKDFSSGKVYKLKEFEDTNNFNHFHNSYFISIAEARKFKLNQINKNENTEI